jgi:hypothetical protein
VRTSTTRHEAKTYREADFRSIGEKLVSCCGIRVYHRASFLGFRIVARVFCVLLGSDPVVFGGWCKSLNDAASYRSPSLLLRPDTRNYPEPAEFQRFLTSLGLCVPVAYMLLFVSPS